MVDSVIEQEVSPVEPQKMQEKLLNEVQVGDIVRREKAAAAERARRETEAKYAQEIEQMKAQMQSGVVAQSTPGSFDPDQMTDVVYKRIMDEVSKHQEQAAQAEHEKAMKNVADQYFLKMGKGSELFEDFSEVMKDFEPAAFPQVVFLASELENTPAVMYELSKNPQKLATIQAMADKSPAMAKKMLGQLSDSIKRNEAAAAENVNVPAPLSRPKSSIVGQDTGTMSIRDFKKAPWLKA